MALCAGLIFVTHAFADNATEDTVPDSAMIEFLGEWMTDTGEDVDPGNFDDEAYRETSAEDDAELSNDR